MRTWKVCYSYLDADGKAWDADEFIYVDTLEETVSHFKGISDAFIIEYGWQRVVVWGVTIMHDFGRNMVKEGME